jgi:hypothetical protein
MSRSALVSCLFFTAVASAEPVTVTSAAPSPHPWGLETELVQPFLPTINIVRLTGTRTLWGSPGGLRGDVMVGGRYRLQTDDAVAQQVTELLLSVGYRQYFWRGLHAEAFVAGGWLAGTNRIDGKRYSGAGFALSATAGYRFGFFEPGGFFDQHSGVGFYVTPQFGFLQVLTPDSLGPRGSVPSTYLQGALLVGLSF